MDSKVICLICCRGDSKSITQKNIKEFCGRPLLSWAIEHAKNSNVFDEIILSTDSLKIAEVGEQQGVLVPGLRPKRLASDDSDVFDTHAYVFDQLGIRDESHVVCILINNPFIDSSLIIEGCKIAQSREFEVIALDTVKVESDYIYFRQLYKQGDLLKFHHPLEMKNSGINRQTDLTTFTAINNTRWGKPSFMSSYDLYKKEIIENGILPIPLPKTRNFDLDDLDDWKIAEAVFEKLFL